MIVRELPPGIFIDYGCKSIIPIPKGVFIPAFGGFCREQFNKELQAFINRWFGDGMTEEDVRAIVQSSL
jgi:hypothetical protein